MWWLKASLGLIQFKLVSIDHAVLHAAEGGILLSCSLRLCHSSVIIFFLFSHDPEHKPGVGHLEWLIGRKQSKMTPLGTSSNGN